MRYLIFVCFLLSCSNQPERVCGVELVNDVMEDRNYCYNPDAVLELNEVGGLGFHFIYQFDSEAVIFRINVVGASSCIDSGSKMVVLFEDGVRLEAAHMAEYNCENSFTIYFAERYENIELLRKFTLVGIERMRVWTVDGYIEVEFNDPAWFLEVFNCVINCK